MATVASSLTESTQSYNSMTQNGGNNQVIFFDDTMLNVEIREDFASSFKNDNVRREFVYIIHQNVLDAMYVLVHAAVNDFHFITYQQLDLDKDSYLIDCIDAILDLTVSGDWTLTKPLAEKIKYLWHEVPAISAAFDRGHELRFEQMDSARYWFSVVDRLSDINYVPTMADILRVRVRTSGVTDTMLHVPIPIKKKTNYFYYNCENEKVRLDIERSSDHNHTFTTHLSFDGSTNLDEVDHSESRPMKDYVVSYTIEDRFKDTKFTIDLDDILPQNTNLLEPIFENKIMKDSEESSKNAVMYKPIKVVLMGSQRSERRKWIHNFDDVSAVFFVVSLSEFNQTLYEDKGTNRMLESLLVFNEIVNSTYFADVPVFLIFNKYDAFIEKLQRFDLSLAFGKEVPEDLRLNAENPFQQFAKNFIEERMRNHQQKFEQDCLEEEFHIFIEHDRRRSICDKTLAYELKNGQDGDMSAFYIAQIEEKNIFGDLISKEERKILKKALAQNKKKTSLFGFLTTPRGRRDDTNTPGSDPQVRSHKRPLGHPRHRMLEKRKKNEQVPVRTLSILDQAIEEESKASCSSLSTMNRGAMNDDNLLKQIMSQTYSGIHVRGMPQLTSTNIGFDCDDDTENDVLDDENEWTYCDEGDIHGIPDLPIDIRIYICMFLEARELCALSEVSYDFYKIATSDIVWRTLCLRYQPDIDENIVISNYAMFMQREEQKKQLITKFTPPTIAADDSQITSDVNKKRIFIKGVYKFWYEFGQSFITRKYLQMTN